MSNAFSKIICAKSAKGKSSICQESYKTIFIIVKSMKTEEKNIKYCQLHYTLHYVYAKWHKLPSLTPSPSFSFSAIKRSLQIAAVTGYTHTHTHTYTNKLSLVTDGEWGTQGVCALLFD